MAASDRQASVSNANAPITLKDINPIANAIIHALFEEYLTYRSSNPFLQFFKKTAGQDHTEERNDVCKSISNKIENRYIKNSFITSMIEILITCEEEARHMQSEAAQKLLGTNASLGTKVLHAVRTCLFSGLSVSCMKEEFKSAIKGKTEELLGLLETNHIDMRNNITTVDMTELAQNRDNLFGQLAALQHTPTIHEAFIQHRFDFYKSLKEVVSANFESNNKIKLYVNIPDIFHPAYHFIYYANNIKNNATRFMKYNSVCEQYLADVTAAGIIEVGDNNYFAMMGGLVADNSVSVKPNKQESKAEDPQSDPKNDPKNGKRR